MPTKTTAWKCDHCGFVSRYRGNTNRHERQCYHNPDIRACATCGNCSEEWDTVYNPHHGGDPGSTDYDVKSYYCSHYEKTLSKDITVLDGMGFERDCEFHFETVCNTGE